MKIYHASLRVCDFIMNFTACLFDRKMQKSRDVKKNCMKTSMTWQENISLCDIHNVFIEFGMRTFYATGLSFCFLFEI